MSNHQMVQSPKFIYLMTSPQYTQGEEETNLCPNLSSLNTKKKHKLSFSTLKTIIQDLYNY